jgi:hypothetical protein
MIREPHSIAKQNRVDAPGRMPYDSLKCHQSIKRPSKLSNRS